MLKDDDIFEFRRNVPEDDETFSEKHSKVTWKTMCKRIIEKAKSLFATKEKLDEIKASVFRLDNLIKLEIEDLKKRMGALESENSNLKRKLDDLQSRIYGDETEVHNNYTKAVRRLLSVIDNLSDLAAVVAKTDIQRVSKLHEDLAKCVSGEISTTDLKNIIIMSMHKEKLMGLVEKIDSFNNNEKQTIINYLEKKKLGTFEQFVYVPKNKQFNNKECEAWYCDLKDGNAYDYAITPYVALPDFPDYGKNEVRKANVSTK